MIERLESRIVHENPRLHVQIRHGCFPGMAVLNPREILVMCMRAAPFVIGSPPSRGRETGHLQK